MNNFITFGEALEALNKGAFVAREGWNDKGMFVYKVEASDPTYDQLRGRCKDAINFVISKENLMFSNQTILHINAHLDMKAANGSIIIGWSATQTDMQADDWYIVKEAK